MLKKLLFVCLVMFWSTNIFAQVDDYIKNSKLGISVFVEDLKIKEILKPYKNITEAIINRQTTNGIYQNNCYCKSKNQ